MTVYTIISIILALWTVALAVLGERGTTKKSARTGDILTSAAGALTAAVGGILTWTGAAKLPDGNFADWTKATVRSFLTVILPVFVLLFAVCAVTSLMSRVNKKLAGGAPHKIRTVMIAASGVFILLLSFVGFIGTNDTFPLGAYLTALGAGLACTMRLCSIIENRGKNND